MPLAIKWSIFSKDSVSRETDNFGVYELGNSDDVLYIGEGQVYTRLMSHFANGLRSPLECWSSYRP